MILHLQLWDFFQGAQEQVRNSRGKRAISVTTVYRSSKQYSIGIKTKADHLTLKAPNN